MQDVPNLGNKYDVKNVSAGYARNFLFPRKLAETANEKKIEEIEIKRKQTEQLQKIDQDILRKNIKELNGIKISIEEKANEKGHLFAGIRREEISKILKQEKHIDIPADLINLEQPIKETGEHKVKVKDKEFILEVKTKKE